MDYTAEIVHIIELLVKQDKLNEHLSKEINALKEENERYKELFWNLQNEVSDMKFWLNERDLLQD